MLTWRELDITSPVGDLADFGIFVILGEAGDGPRFGLVLVAQVEGFASRRSFWADFRDSGGGRGWRYQ